MAKKNNRATRQTGNPGGSPTDGEIENALRELIEDDGCFDELESSISDVNAFAVLGVSNLEIRHSNMLAWLLDPSANHGIGDRFLQKFVYAIARFDKPARHLFFDLFVSGDYGNCRVLREWKDIDILLVFASVRWVICIENKIRSKDGRGQLAKYEDSIGKAYPKWEKTFLYLTPDGEEPRNAANLERWRLVSHEDVLALVGKCLSVSDLKPKTRSLLEQYRDTLKEMLMGRPKLEKVAKAIYAKHKMALEFIFETRDDAKSARAAIFEKWVDEKQLQGSAIVVPDFSRKTIIRFSTDELRELYPLLPSGMESLWCNAQCAAFEIVNEKDSVRLQIAVSDVYLDVRAKQATREFLARKKGRGKKQYWDDSGTWYVLASTARLPVSPVFTEDEQDLLKQFLDAGFTDLQSKVTAIRELLTPTSVILKTIKKGR